MLAVLSYLKLQNLWRFLQFEVFEVHKCLVKVEKALKLYSKIFWERDHIDRTLMTVSCHNCFIFLLVIIVNLLLYIIYKLKFIICKSRKNLSTHGVWYYPWFWGSWNVSPTIRGDYYSEQFILWASHSADQGMTLSQLLLPTSIHSSLNRKKSKRMR